MDLFDNEIFEIIFYSFIAVISLFFMTKLLGKKQVSELSLFDYVLGISIGNFAAEMVISYKTKFLDSITALIVFCLVGCLISFLSMKSLKLRKFFVGVPTILIQHGHLIYDNLKKSKFDINDLLEEARCNGYFDIYEIEYAILEASGNVSFLPKGEYKNITIKDMNLKAQKQGLCANVIIDGNIIIENLNNINKDEEWLLHELKLKGKKVHDILLATVDINDKLNIYDRKYNEKVLEILE